MAIYFKDGFYDTRVHSSIPSGAVEITESVYIEMINGQALGLRITTGPGGTPQLVGPTSDELFSLAQSDKYAEIEAAFAQAEATPVSVNGWLFKGGFTSGLAIDAQRRMVVEYAAAMPELGITTVDFFDIYGQTITVPITSSTELDALDVTLSIGFATQANTFNYAQKMAAIGAASTIEEVQAIAW